MKDSGLPCFKGENTIRKLETRFQLHRSENQAAIFVKSLIKASYGNMASSFYDYYQKQTNGIPY
jgi:phosphatidylinositol 4-kinase